MTGYNCNICTGATGRRQLQTCQLSHILDPSPAYPHWTPNLLHTGLLWVWSFFGLVVTLTRVSLVPACLFHVPLGLQASIRGNGTVLTIQSPRDSRSQLLPLFDFPCRPEVRKGEEGLATPGCHARHHDGQCQI